MSHLEPRERGEIVGGNRDVEHVGRPCGRHPGHAHVRVAYGGRVLRRAQQQEVAAQRRAAAVRQNVAQHALRRSAVCEGRETGTHRSRPAAAHEDAWGRWLEGQRGSRQAAQRACSRRAPGSCWSARCRRHRPSAPSSTPAASCEHEADEPRKDRTQRKVQSTQTKPSSS